MPSPRTCSHVKINGVKCGSPALKYHTHCYFHYQWLNRRANPYHFDLKEGWTTMRLPPLESKASILFAISEIQESLLTGSIDFKMAKALFYGIQLAIQLKATADDLGARETPETCYELEDELHKARWRHKRPPQAVCDSCERANACHNADHCHLTTDQIRELERLHEPERYARQRKDEEYEKELERKYSASVPHICPPLADVGSPAPSTTCHHERSEGSASSPTSTNLNSNTTPSPRLEGARLQPCHKDAGKPGASAPEVHSPQTPQTQTPTSSSPATTTLPLEGSPARQSGDSNEQISTSRADARRQTQDHKLFHSPAHFSRLESKALNEINILRSNS